MPGPHGGLRPKQTYEGLLAQMVSGLPDLDEPDRRAMFSRGRLNLRSVDLLRGELKARKTKTESLNMRKGWIERQKRANYQNEYDRIRGILSQTILPEGAKRLEDRLTELKGLGIAGPSLMV